jgi:hydrogenase expression/formation protein HypC
MCLAIPGRVLSNEGGWAVCEVGGSTIRARCDLLPDISPDEYCLIHAGFVIQRIDTEEAARTLAVLKDLGYENATEAS